MHSSFATIGQRQGSHIGDNSFWPSFTDIMMVITMIFLMATSLLIVRNWQLVAELQQSVAAEQLAAEMIESTTQVNATLEERLTNAEQANSILRLRLLQKDESLQAAKENLNQQELTIAVLQADNTELQQSLQQANIAITAANLEIESVNARYETLASQVARLSEQLEKQRIESDKTLKSLELAKSESEATLTELELAKTEIRSLTVSSQAQQQNIANLTQEKLLLDREVAQYNQQLLSLKGEYEVVKSKYEELIKPARSARGKYITEVYYIKGESGKIIRYKEPGDAGFTNLPLNEVEKRLARLKAEKGNDLYVKIIIPQDSGLTYSEAWDFMRSLLVKYDYYYQE